MKYRNLLFALILCTSAILTPQQAHAENEELSSAIEEFKKHYTQTKEQLGQEPDVLLIEKSIPPILNAAKEGKTEAFDALTEAIDAHLKGETNKTTIVVEKYYLLWSDLPESLQKKAIEHFETFLKKADSKNDKCEQELVFEKGFFGLKDLAQRDNQEALGILTSCATGGISKDPCMAEAQTCKALEQLAPLIEEGNKDALKAFSKASRSKKDTILHIVANIASSTANSTSDEKIYKELEKIAEKAQKGLIKAYKKTSKSKDKSELECLKKKLTQDIEKCEDEDLKEDFQKILEEIEEKHGKK